MPVYSFSIRVIIANAWKAFRAHTTEYVLYALALIIFSNLIEIIIPKSFGVLWIVQLLVSPAIGLMCARVGLLGLVDKVPEWQELLKLTHYREALVAVILQMLIVGAGFILLIIPGFIAMVGLAFTTLVIADKGLTAVDALKESWRITKGNRLQIFVLFLVIVLMNLLGALALVVGLLVSIPVSILALAGAYRALTTHAGAHISEAHS